MKKISSLIVCLAILSLGTAFALDLPDALKIPGLTVTGDVRTGLRVDGGTVDDYGKLYDDDPTSAPATGALDTTVYAYSDDIDDGTALRAQLQLVWQRDNLGVKTRFRYRPDKADGDLSNKLADLNNTVNQAFVWGDILDKKARVTVGKALDGAWGLFYSNFGPGRNGNFDGKDGVKLEVKPIDGLNVGAFYGTGNLFNKAVKGGSYTNLSDYDRRLVVGAKYTSDLFSVVAATSHNFIDEFDGKYDGYDGPKDSDNNPIYIKEDPSAYVDAGLPNTSNLLVGVKVNPIEALQLDLSFLAVNLGTKTYKDVAGDDVAGKYKKGDYNDWWHAFLKFKASFDVNDQLGLALEISDLHFADAYYTAVKDTNPEDSGLGHLFPITISPSASYAINDDLAVGLGLNVYINSGGSDQFGFGVKPSAEFSLGSGATFVVWDEIAFWGQSNDDADFLTKHPDIYAQGGNGGAAGTTNALQFDFVWTF